MKFYGFYRLMGRVFILVLAIVCCFSGRAQNVPVTIDDPLCRAMQATGAEVIRSHMTGRVALAEGAMESTQARLILEAAARELGIASTDIETQTSAAQQCFKLSYSDSERQAVIVVRRIQEGHLVANEPELLIHIIQQNPLHTDITKTNQLMTKFLQKFNQMPQINTCLEGVLDGKLRKDEWAFYLQDAVDAIGVEVMDRIDDSAYMCYTGYTPVLPYKVMANSRMVNFHAAMRYHSFDNKTYIFIGSPLITVDY